MIAGYDTTAVVLTSLFYHVLGSKEVHTRLQEEVDSYFRSVDSNSRLESSNLAELPYLNAVMSVFYLFSGLGSLSDLQITEMKHSDWAVPRIYFTAGRQTRPVLDGSAISV